MTAHIKSAFADTSALEVTPEEEEAFVALEKALSGDTSTGPAEPVEVMTIAELQLSTDKRRYGVCDPGMKNDF
ncbi:MAG: hypothetical protein JWO78_638 [Micavibrio sp.]|nr:hypothetical protein [Micavibrio sp.]